jgi:hypothetical protein
MEAKSGNGTKFENELTTGVESAILSCSKLSGVNLKE